MLHEDVTGQIIVAAQTVLYEPKPGLDEKLYERALVIELKQRGLVISSQQSFPVSYKGTCIGQLIPDILVNGLVIVDTKVVKTFCDEHIAQMLGYLSITGLQVALLLNFKSSTLQVKRVVR